MDLLKNGTGFGPPTFHYPKRSFTRPGGLELGSLFPHCTPGSLSLEKGGCCSHRALHATAPLQGWRCLRGGVCLLPLDYLPLTPTPSRMRVKEPTEGPARPPKTCPWPLPLAFPDWPSPLLCFPACVPDGLATPGPGLDLGP